MKRIDMRFDESIIRKWIGKKFVKYQCDAFDFTNSVTQIVGLFIADSVYKLTNIQRNVDYYGYMDDIAVCTIEGADESEIKSAFKETEQIITPVEGLITKIKIVNENQIVESSSEIYDVWLTRAIIFEVDGREIMFEKDVVPFSEEIIIRRGYELMKKISDEKTFLEGWDNGMNPKCVRKVIEINM